MKTEAIVFSKQRTLQLKSLLLSMRELSDFPEGRVNVIYLDSPEIDYGHLKESFDCSFIKQEIFLEDVRRIVDTTNSEYILFMVDDLVFRDSFSIAAIEGLMDSRPDIDSFCFRMGRNIAGPQPDFIELGGGLIAWDARRGLGRHWNYFWELSSSIYRRALVEEYLSKCRKSKERFPNPLEFHYYSCMPSTRALGAARLLNSIRFLFRRTPKRAACFEKSRAMTLGVNLVADLAVERSESFSPLDLHRKMLEGYVSDFSHLKNFENKSPNAGPSEFRLVKLPLSIQEPQGESR